MTSFGCHTIVSAPLNARKLLQSSINNFGWIPNQSAHMAESPGLLEAYQRAHDLFNNGSLNETERAVVWITVGQEYRCTYTVQAHLYIAERKAVEIEVLRALLDGSDNLTARLLVLRDFTRHVANCCGQVNDEAAAKFLAAGFSPQNLLDVILGVSQKTMSTLLNSVAKTDIDQRFTDTVLCPNLMAKATTRPHQPPLR